MKRIYSVLVENRAGVLSKVSGLFSRRNFNIDSLVVGETADKSVSCMTIVSSGDERTIEQIEKQLNKKIDVIKVKTFKESMSINRELMLMKVKYNKENRKTQAKFACIQCGFQENADVVGAMNILRAGLARIACEVSGAVMPPAAGTHRSDSGVLSCS